MSEELGKAGKLHTYMIACFPVGAFCDINDKICSDSVQMLTFTSPESTILHNLPKREIHPTEPRTRDVELETSCMRALMNTLRNIMERIWTREEW